MNEKNKQCVAIVGAGAAGLMAADHLSALRPDLNVILYDAMPSPARKILMAGKSGLNITHKDGVEDPDHFVLRYGRTAGWMKPMLEDFGSRDLIRWMETLGQESFTGSSGRIFPKVMKASPLLRALLKRLEERGVTLNARHRWMGWDEQGLLLFATMNGVVSINADATLLALGGPSWPKLGTDGAFISCLEEKGLDVRSYRPANCGFDVGWPEAFSKEWAGHPVKSVKLSFGDQTVQGDFVITQTGIEGGAVYALSAILRDAIELRGEAILQIDLRPNQTAEALTDRLSRPRGKQSLSNHLRKSIHLAGLPLALVKLHTSREDMADAEKLAHALKSLPVCLTRPRPIDEAISTAGGIALSELDEHLMVKRQPGLFLAGEMLDWEAPTGGYLLMACFSQGYRAASGIDHFLR